MYEWTDAARNINFTQSQTWIEAGEKIFVVTATSLTEDYQKFAPIFERMVSSFRLK